MPFLADTLSINVSTRLFSSLVNICAETVVVMNNDKTIIKNNFTFILKTFKRSIIYSCYFTIGKSHNFRIRHHAQFGKST